MTRARPTQELLNTLHESKSALHRDRRSVPLREKVRILLELQRAVLPMIARRRPLRPWERPWDIDP